MSVTPQLDSIVIYFKRLLSKWRDLRGICFGQNPHNYSDYLNNCSPINVYELL